MAFSFFLEHARMVGRCMVWHGIIGGEDHELLSYVLGWGSKVLWRQGLSLVSLCSITEG